MPGNFRIRVTHLLTRHRQRKSGSGGGGQALAVNRDYLCLGDTGPELGTSSEFRMGRKLCVLSSLIFPFPQKSPSLSFVPSSVLGRGSQGPSSPSARIVWVCLGVVQCYCCVGDDGGGGSDGLMVMVVV